MEFTDPVKCVSYEEVLDFIFFKIKDLGTPVRMLSLARVRIFIDTLAVKAGKTMCIRAEMRRYPVKDNSYIVLMEKVYKIHEVYRLAISGCRCIIACYLIAP